MTMSVTITNTSNWDGENIELEVNGKVQLLVPGENIVLSMQSATRGIRIKDASELKIKPFLDKDQNGRQIFPRALTIWEP